MIAITMTDLYPNESWNFVFGQASIENRVGVFSFARYHPSWRGGEADENTERLVLTRAAKVLTHETGHMFGIRLLGIFFWGGELGGAVEGIGVG
jgi:archaemetzincin